MRKCFPKTVKKTTKPRINYNFFSREKQKDRVSITMETASKVSSYASLLAFAYICIIATKRSFLSKVMEFYALKSDSADIIHGIGKILGIKTAIRRVFSLI